MPHYLEYQHMSEFSSRSFDKPATPKAFTPEQSHFFSLEDDRNILSYDAEAIRALPEFKACEPIFRAYAMAALRTAGGEGESWVATIARAYVDGRPYSTSNSSYFGKKEAAESLVKLAQRLGFSAHSELKYAGETGYVFVLDAK